MLKKEELKLIYMMLLRRATKEQLLSTIQYIEQVPLKNKMNKEEYEEFYNEIMKGKSFQKYYLKRR